MNNNIKMPENCYMIGGSPCCGKSTIAGRLASEKGFSYYKYDNHLEQFINLGAKRKIQPMAAIKNYTLDETWLRDVPTQVEEEFEFYRKAFPMALFNIAKLRKDRPIIIEGAGMLPELMEREGIAKNRYICMVPKRSFQVNHYSRRGWVKPYLEKCSDPDKAFENWMERDSMFADKVRFSAEQLGYQTITVDGLKSIDEIYEMVKGIFELD